MKKAKPTIDVFVSHDRRNRNVVDEIVRVLRSYDLEVFTDDEIPVGGRIEDAIWEAMSESQALITVISSDEPSASVAFEVGAAKAWNMPIYGIVSEPAMLHDVPALHGTKLFPPSRIDEVAQEIRRASDALSKSEIDALIEEYNRIGVPLDQLALQPQHLVDLTKQFQKRTKRRLSGERLLHFLLRLRKKRELPTVSSSSS